MNSKTETIKNSKSLVGNIISWLFGIVVFAIGVINTFWGNDPGFGILLVLLSFVYFPLVNTIIRNRIGFSIPVVVKIILGIFIIWASLGVGELFDKIELMMMDLNTPSMTSATNTETRSGSYLLFFFPLLPLGK